MFSFHARIPLGLALLAIFVSVLGAMLATAYLLEETPLGQNITLPKTNEKPAPFSYGAWPVLANADYFNTVRASFIKEKKDFLEADLSAMRLRVFLGGEEVLTVPIKSKGREGSWWETPSGLYRAEGKEKVHFSSIGKVYMPWSIPFQGNFFIHGWPYYEDGTPVSSSYSGGCIRLADEHAKAVYDLVKVGLPVLVFEKDFTQDSFTYRIDAPAISAKSYLVADLKNNFVLLSGGVSDVQKSTLHEKLMTALIASEYQDIEKKIMVKNEMLVPSPAPRLVAGETYRVYDLLHPLLLEDSGEAAEALSFYLGRDRFVALMGAKARAIGMTHSVFKSPSGADGKGETTAEDFFAAAKYLYNNRPFILRMSAGRAERGVYGSPVFKGLEPAHPFYEDAAFLGGLADSTTPHTQKVSRAKEESVRAQTASLTLAFATSTAMGAIEDNPSEEINTHDLFALFEISFGSQKRPLVFIVLDSADVEADIAKMRAYIARMYR